MSQSELIHLAVDLSFFHTDYLWRMPGSWTGYPYYGPEFYEDIARMASRGVMDLLFFGDSAAAFANIARALRPGGRLALLVWQGPEANEWIAELSGAMAAGRDLPVPPISAPGPFAQADPRAVRAGLTAAGLTDIEVHGLREPMWLGADAADAHAFASGLLGWMLGGLDDAGRGRALENLRATVIAHDTGHGVFYQSATWLICASRP